MKQRQDWEEQTVLSQIRKRHLILFYSLNGSLLSNVLYKDRYFENVTCVVVSLCMQIVISLTYEIQQEIICG